MGQNVHPSVHIETAKRGVGSFDQLMRRGDAFLQKIYPCTSLHCLAYYPFAPLFGSLQFQRW